MRRVYTKGSYLVVLVLVTVLLAGCASKKYAKRAMKYEEAGMYELAVDNYLISLTKKDEKNDQARIGLMRSSKRYSDEIVSKLDAAYSSLNDELVVQYFQALKKLQEKVRTFRVELDINNKTLGQYNESKGRYLKATYTKAQDFMDKEMFQEASASFEEVLKVNPTYERAKEFYIFSKCEPEYRTAKQNLQNKLNRSAYWRFSKILKIDATFKDAKELQAEALQNAMLTIAVKSIDHQRRHSFLYEQTMNEIKTSFGKNTNPFLKLVSLEHTQAMLEEQKKALENNLAFDATALIPIRVYLVGNIISSDFELSKRIKKEQKAYLQYTDKQRMKRYKKVYYFDCTQSASARCKFGYEFIGVESASVLTAGNVEKNYSDKVNYAISDYDSKDLYPADWGDGRKDTMYTDFIRVSAMRMKFSARSTLYNQQDFEKSFAGAVSSEIVKKIDAYDPEK